MWLFKKNRKLRLCFKKNIYKKINTLLFIINLSSLFKTKNKAKKKRAEEGGGSVIKKKKSKTKVCKKKKRGSFQGRGLIYIEGLGV